MDMTIKHYFPKSDGNCNFSNKSFSALITTFKNVLKQRRKTETNQTSKL